MTVQYIEGYMPSASPIAGCGLLGEATRVLEHNIFVSRYLPRNKKSSLCPLCLCGENPVLDAHEESWSLIKEIVHGQKAH